MEGTDASMKRGRNDPCWCGSGLKYKKCHLDRESSDAVRPWDIDKEMRNCASRGTCLHVGQGIQSICGRPAVRSHSVPKSMLKRIAHNGHLYFHSGTVMDFERTGGELRTRLIGINSASVLPVYCQSHDNDTFAPLERVAFCSTKEQCFLLTYRAVCLEYQKKSNDLAMIPAMRQLDRGKKLGDQILIQARAEAISYSFELSLRDLATRKTKLDSMLLAHDFSDMYAYVVTFDSDADVLCSSILYPEYDFDGRSLQDLSNPNTTMEIVAFSLLTTPAGSAFVMAWDKDSEATCRRLANSLDSFSDRGLGHGILRFIFEFCENNYIRPAWWDNLEPEIRGKISARMQRAISDEARLPGCLADDGVRAEWKVNSREWL